MKTVDYKHKLSLLSNGTYLTSVAQVVEANKDARAKAAAEADALLTQEQLAFEAWRDSLETVPTIKVGFAHLNLNGTKTEKFRIMRLA